MLVEVISKQDIKAFLRFPIGLYKRDKNWVRPLDKDIEEVFDKKKNKFFRHGEATRWILKDDSGTVIGRVAAFINRKSMKEKNSQGQQLVVGGMGFFESVEDQNVANELFETAAAWLKERDCNTMEGPINFGERDTWWGLLVDGFDRQPNYRMPYTKPYYIDYFEQNGFQLYFKQLTFGRPVWGVKLNPKYEEKAARIARDPKYKMKYLDLKQLDKFTEDFRTIYNKAWVKHAGVGEMSSAQAQAVMKQIKPLMDPKVMYFAYYGDDPIGFFLILPELNEVLKHIHGKLNAYGIVLFLYYKLFKRFTKIVGRGFGIVPEHQGKGVEGAIVNFSAEVVHNQIKRNYKEFEMNWIGDFNKPMVKLCSDIGSIVKTHHTYRRMLDDSLMFERCPDIH